MVLILCDISELRGSHCLFYTYIFVYIILERWSLSLLAQISHCNYQTPHPSPLFQVIYGVNKQASACPGGIHWICPAMETNPVETGDMETYPYHLPFHSSVSLIHGKVFPSFCRLFRLAVRVGTLP